PPDDAARCEVVGDTLDQLRLVELLHALAVLARRAREIVCVDGGTPERMVGYLAIWIAEVDPVRVQRGAQCTAGIAGRRRYEYAVESRFGQNACVRHAVERDAASETEIGQARIAAQPRGDVNEDVFEHPLHACRAVGEALA